MIASTSLVAKTRLRLVRRRIRDCFSVQHDNPADTRCPVLTPYTYETKLGCIALHSTVSLGRDRYLRGRRKKMSIWTILFVVLLIAWLGGFTVFHVAGGLIHLLLVFAVISLILHFVMGSRTA